MPFALALAFAVVGQLHPTGLVAVGQMALGLVVAAWLAYGVLRARRRPHPPAGRSARCRSATVRTRIV